MVSTRRSGSRLRNVLKGHLCDQKQRDMENEYFKEALSSMVEGVAYGDAVKHLYDHGYSIEAIQKHLDYPTSVEKIEKVIRDYEAKKSSVDSGYEYVQRTDEFGRRSFIRIAKNKDM